MRLYEPFKSDAQRLTSITCDKCGAELYRTPRQPAGTLDYHGASNDQKLTVWKRGGYDLCPACLEAVEAVIVAFIGKEPTR